MEGLTNTLSVLGGFAGQIAGAAATYINAQDAADIAIAQQATKQKELDYLYQQEKKATVQAAAEGARSVVNNETVKQIAIWTLTTIAGGVLVGVVMKMAGLSK